MAQRPAIEPSSFVVTTSPDPALLGRSLEGGPLPRRPALQLRFGDVVAGLPIPDLWSACCELLLEAQLVREGLLDRFVLDVEHVFDVSCSDGAVLCRFSPEHVFLVDAEEFASALEHAVDQIFAGTSCPRLMHIAARWSASSIRAQPYSYRFSDSTLI